MDCDKFIQAVNWLLDNINVTLGDTTIRQIISIPMSFTNIASLLASLYIFFYEYK